MTLACAIDVLIKLENISRINIKDYYLDLIFFVWAQKYNILKDLKVWKFHVGMTL